MLQDFFLFWLIVWRSVQSVNFFLEQSWFHGNWTGHLFQSAQKVLHPSTVMSKEYYRARSTTFSSQMLSFAKQSEEINATVNTDMQVPPAPCKHTHAAVPVWICLCKFTTLPPPCSKWSWPLMYMHQWNLLLLQKVRLTFYTQVSVPVLPILSSSLLCGGL